MHCVRVSLTGTTVAPLWARGSLVGIGLCTFYLPYTILWTIGGLPPLYCNGATPWQCSQWCLLDPTMMRQSFTWGLFVSISLSVLKVLDVLHRLAGAQYNHWIVCRCLLSSNVQVPQDLRIIYFQVNLEILESILGWAFHSFENGSICSVLGVSEPYLIIGLASDGDWAPNDQMWETGWELG